MDAHGGRSRGDQALKFEFHFLFALLAIGLLTRRLSWRGWFAVALFVSSWITLCMIKG